MLIFHILSHFRFDLYFLKPFRNIKTSHLSLFPIFSLNHVFLNRFNPFNGQRSPLEALQQISLGRDMTQPWNSKILHLYYTVIFSPILIHISSNLSNLFKCYILFLVVDSNDETHSVYLMYESSASKYSHYYMVYSRPSFRFSSITLFYWYIPKY